MELPIKPLDIKNLKSNITYGEIQSLSFEDVASWVDVLRTELLHYWDDKNIPPSTGIDKDTIKDRFNKLSDYDVSALYIQDDLYKDYLGFIKNFTKIGSGVNQFFPALLKSQVQSTSSIPLSIYDYLSREDLYLEFKYKVVQKVRFDKMYIYTQSLKKETNVNDRDCFVDWLGTKDSSVKYFLEPTISLVRGENTEKVMIDKGDVKKWLDEGFIDDEVMINQEQMSFDGEADGYFVRYYDINQKVFPNILQVLRLGLNQVAVNFPPLTARLIYEKYLDDKNKQYNIMDFCAGWGGRLLGALSSNRNIHYVGIDVNKSNVGCYEGLADFYNNNCDGKNTYEMFYEGAEVIHQNKTWKKFLNKIDLVFTSPPYFNREVYSMDEEQSCLKYPDYQDWKENFLEMLIKNSYKVLKIDGYMIINISDIRITPKRFIPLEQDTISIALNNGFRYIGKVGMVMARMVGLNPTDTKNYWLDMKTQTTYKVEPIFIFAKEPSWPWDES